MFDFFKSTRDSWPEETVEWAAIKAIHSRLDDMQKVIDAICQVYVRENRDEIRHRGLEERYWAADQPIIDRAKVLELDDTIRSARFELDQLQKKRG